MHVLKIGFIQNAFEVTKIILGSSSFPQKVKGLLWVSRSLCTNWGIAILRTDLELKWIFRVRHKIHFLNCRNHACHLKGDFIVERKKSCEKIIQTVIFLHIRGKYFSERAEVTSGYISREEFLISTK